MQMPNEKHPVTKKPSVALMLITPTMADNWLEHANGYNRHLSNARTERMARDIKSGKFLLTHEGVAFDVNGNILDGQHRLRAIVIAGQAVWMYVFFDFPVNVRMVIDSGKPRNAADNLSLAGGYGTVSSREIAIVRAMLQMGIRGGLMYTISEIDEHFRKHRDAIAFAMRHMSKTTRIQGLFTASTRAVIARAFYSADLDRLIRFCQVLSKGIGTQDEDEPALMLWQYLTSNSSHSHPEVRTRYLKTERALAAFLNRERITALRAATGELFPLPQETAIPAAGADENGYERTAERADGAAFAVNESVQFV